MKRRLILFLFFVLITTTGTAQVLSRWHKQQGDGLCVDGLWKVVAAWTDGKRTHFDDENSGYFRISKEVFRLSKEEASQQETKVFSRRKIEFGRVVAGKFQRTRTPIGFSLSRLDQSPSEVNHGEIPLNYRWNFTPRFDPRQRPRLHFKHFEYVEEQQSTLGLFLLDEDEKAVTLVLCGHASHKDRKSSRPKNPARKGKPGDGLAITVLKFVKR